MIPVTYFGLLGFLKFSRCCPVVTRGDTAPPCQDCLLVRVPVANKLNANFLLQIFLRWIVEEENHGLVKNYGAVMSPRKWQTRPHVLHRGHHGQATSPVKIEPPVGIIVHRPSSDAGKAHCDASSAGPSARKRFSITLAALSYLKCLGV
jgi:hypothetical protein